MTLRIDPPKLDAGVVPTDPMTGSASVLLLLRFEGGHNHQAALQASLTGGLRHKSSRGLVHSLLTTNHIGILSNLLVLVLIG